MNILDKNGRPIKASKTPPRRPLPAAPINRSHRDYVATGLTPEGIAPVFRAADGGDLSAQAQLFEQLLEHDGHLVSEYTKRVNAINSQYLDWQLTPASDSQRDLDVVNYIEKYFLNHPSWSDYKKAQQSAVGYGYAAIEAIWETSEGYWWIKEFRGREHNEFTYTNPETGYLLDWPLIITDDEPMGVPFDPDSLILHTSCGLIGHAARSGVFRPVTYMIVFKHFSVKDWWTFSELCGIPLRVGYYEDGASDEDLSTLQRALENLGIDMYALISRGTEIEFKEAAAKTSSAEIWEGQVRLCNDEISKAVVGTAGFSDPSKAGSYAMHTVETGVRADLTLADAEATAVTDREQVIAPLVRFRFGPDVPLPEYKVVFKKQEDLAQKAKWLEPVADRVADRIPYTWYAEQYGIPALQKGDRTLAEVREQVTAAKGRPLYLAKADTLGGDEITELTDAAMDKIDLSVNEDKILRVIQESSSYQEVYDRLADLYSELDLSGFEKVMQQALLMAQAAGMKKGQQDE